MAVTFRSSGSSLDNLYLQFDQVGLPRPDASGFLYSWGDNTHGHLGTGTSGVGTFKSSPVQVGSLTNWNIICSGVASHAIKYDGTLWGWGYNANGQIGDGTVLSKSSPVQIGSLTNWKSLASGPTHSLAIKTDGTLWTWGSDGSGALGLYPSSSGSKSSPVQVGSLTDWKQVSCGNSLSVAIKTDGTLWTWGDGTYGQLGEPGIGSRSSPVQVGTLTDWSSCVGSYYNAAAIKTDGTLWTWGRNLRGQLGDGTIVDKSSPIQVGTLTDWKQVSCGNNEFMAAIKTDGTLWTWGYNNNGQLGLGDTTSRSSPVQVGALTNWAYVNVRHYSAFALKTDGTLWSWGYNLNGYLGHNDITARSSPTQVGTLNTWTSIDSLYAVHATKSYY